MDKLFGKTKKLTVQEQSEQINKTIEDLNKREEYYEKQIAKEEKKAREFMKKGNKKDALECINARKYFEKCRDNMSAMAFDLEMRKTKMSEIHTTADVIQTLNNDVMKQLFAKVNIDDVVIDDTFVL